MTERNSAGREGDRGGGGGSYQENNTLKKGRTTQLTVPVLTGAEKTTTKNVCSVITWLGDTAKLE